MANSLFYPDPEDEEGQPNPDSTVAAEGRTTQPVNPPLPTVKEFLMNKNSSTKPSDSIETDPLMAQYLKDQSELEDFRNVKIQADTESNIGQSLSQLSLGTNKPQENPVFRTIANQNKEMVESKEGDIDRKRKVMDAIENRNTRKSDQKFKRDLVAATRGKTNTDIKSLPAEDQEVVKDLAKKNAHKIAIANQIEAVMSKWNQLSNDQKVTQGRQLIKTLNSIEGSDAVGAEEVKRLGAKLEFAMGNLTNSNPTQFGRDLAGFEEQARLTSQGLRTAITSNDNEIAKRYGKVGIHRDVSALPTDPDMKKADPRDQTKVINGKTYRKVAGGWEEVE